MGPCQGKITCSLFFLLLLAQMLIKINYIEFNFPKKCRSTNLTQKNYSIEHIRAKFLSSAYLILHEPYSARRHHPPPPPPGLLPASNGEIGDGVEVRAQHFGVLEELVSEGVEPVQGDEQVSGRHPFLEKKKRTDGGEKGCHKTQFDVIHLSLSCRYKEPGCKRRI